MSDLYIDNSGIPYDLALEGIPKSNGSINELWGRDALTNAIKMWLASNRGERPRALNSGGYLVYWLNKPMATVSPNEIAQSIRDGLAQDFKPELTISYLDIQPDYKAKTWNIKMQAYCNSLKISVAIDEYIKTQYSE